VEEHPRSSPLVLEDIRQAIVPRFPYSIFYTLEDDVLVVVAVFHLARDPADWSDRR